MSEDDPALVAAEDLARCTARLFASADGARLLDHLTRAFLLRRLPPAASDAELRHLEGQRSLVAHLQGLISRGAIR